MSHRSLPNLLQQRAERTGDRPAIFFRDGEDWTTWTWAEYWDRARRMASGLRASGVRPGDRVLILSPDVRTSVAIHFGSWTLGAVPAHLGLPYRLTNIAGFLEELRTTGAQLETSTLVVGRALAAFVPPQREFRVLVAEDLMETSDAEAVVSQDAGPALIQLTSGSTGHPRAVVVPHDRVIRHLERVSERLPGRDTSVGVTWLPLYHDMGLIGGILYPCFTGFPVYVLAPTDFQRNPYVWLQAMSRVHATHTAAPPSAYAICLKLAARAAEDRLDLAALSCAMIGAEPIYPSLLRRFADGFAACGFRAEAFFPVYGLAEATVAVTFPELLAPTRVDRIDRERFEREGVAEPVAASAVEIEFVGVGSPLPGTELRIRGPRGDDLPERREGEIWVRSESLMEGYYNDADATAAVFEDGWLDTGDRGYLAGGTLFVTGRTKDLIIAGGRNLVPSAIEQIASAVPGVREGCIAAVGVPSEERATEQVCLVAETRSSAAEHAALASTIREALKVRGINVDHVILVPPRTLPKTSSGKIKRSLIVSQLQAGVLPGLRSAMPQP